MYLLDLQPSVSPNVTMTFPNLVRVESAAARADASSDRCAFATTGESANPRACRGGCSDRQFVTVLLPEAPLVTTMTNRCSGRRCGSGGRLGQHG
jgi:hypothetical protein